MRSPNWKNNKKRVLKFLFISFILTFPNILNNIQNSSLGFSEDSNQLGIYSSKIDSQLLQLINSNEDSQSLPIIVLYNYNDKAFKAELEENSNTPIYNYKIIPATSLLLSSNKISTIAKSPLVKRIYLDKKVYPLSFEKTKLSQDVREPFTQQLPYIPLINQSLSQIGAPYLWDLDLNGSGVVVAVLDTGIDKTHPDLNDLDDNPLTTNDPKVVNETSFIDLDYNGIPDENPSDKVGHGTHVAGIISGTGEASSYKYKGVAPGSRLMNIKVLTTYGGFTSWTIKGLEYASIGPDGIEDTGDEADIISMSLGGSGFIDDLVVQAVDAAWDLNKTVIIAAGNSGDEFFTLDSPGLSSKAITVGAVDQFDQIAYFSSRGPSPDIRMGIDICAPGVNIISAQANLSTSSGNNVNYTSKSGSSMATPFVAGAIALLLQSDPKLLPDAIKTLLMVSAVDIGESSYVQGAGRLDIYGAYCLNNKQTGISILNRLDLTELVYFDNDGIFGYYETPFYSGYLGDYHYNQTGWERYNDIWETFFAIKYNTMEGEKFYLSSDLIKNYPYEMRWLIRNATHNIATESLKTPDDVLRIDIFYELYNNSKWLRISFNITSLGEIEAKNTKFFYYMDTFIYESEKLANEEDYYDDGEYIQDINALVASDTYYTNPQFGYPPNNYLGFSSVNKPIAFEINTYYEAYLNMLNDQLTNKTSHHGDLGLVQEWLNTTISQNNHAFIPIIIAFGDNRSHFINNINEGKNKPYFGLIPDIAINTLSVPNPIYNGTSTILNFSVVNVGFTPSSNFDVTTYLDDIPINVTQINGLNPNEEIIIRIPIKFNKTGNYKVRIEADFSQGEYITYYYSNNKLERIIKVITPLLATFFPQNPLDNPMKLKYAGQFLYWNCCIIKGENFSDLKLNKTGTGKSFVSFNGNPANTLLLEGGLGHNYVNISIDVPKDALLNTYDINLQLLNSSIIISEVCIEFELEEFLPVHLLITNMTIDDDGLEDDDGIIEGEEDGRIEFFVNSTEATEFVDDIFMIVTYRNDTTIEILDYNIEIEDDYDKILNYNDSIWSEDDFDFTVPYNFSNSVVEFNSIFFAQIGYSNDFIPFFHNKFNCSIKQRIPGIPDLELDSYQYLDLDSCDYDGIVEPGEVGVFGLNFRNKGNGSALQIFNTNFSCSDSRVTIPQPYYEWHFFIFIFIIPTIHIQWNGIDPSDTTESYSGFPVFILPSSIPPSTVLNFEIEIEYCNIKGDQFKETFQFSYTVPGVGNGNGDGDGDGNGEDDMVMILLIISMSSIGGIVAVVAIIIKRRKSGFSRE